MALAAGSTKITKKQGLAFTAAWLGWAFDGLDGFIYTLVALPFVGELIHKAPRDPETMGKAALIQAVFLVGWAIGGAVFGRIGDKVGRSKTLNLTILTYACFTGLSVFAGAWWHLLIFRFVAALGIGGEWAAGSALVSETLPARFRHLGSAILQSGYMVGMLLATFSYHYMSSYPPRWIFLIGVLPAFATFWIRKAVPEPEEWQREKENQETPPVAKLFGSDVIKTTLKVLVMSAITLCGAWTILYYSAVLIRNHPDNIGLTQKQLGEAVITSTQIYVCWTILGNLFTAIVTKYVGFRKGFVFLLICSLIAFLVGFSTPRSAADSQTWINATAFFGLGVFGAFPLYFPPLFPVLLRTTGAGFCYNMGRIITAIGTFFAGKLPDARLVFFYAGFLYIFAILLAFTMPELKKDGDALAPGQG